MDNRRDITSGFNEIWGRLRVRWKGKDANTFHQQYVVKMSEAIEDFEGACFGLSTRAAELSKKLHIIEQSIDKK